MHFPEDFGNAAEIGTGDRVKRKLFNEISAGKKIEALIARYLIVRAFVSGLFTFMTASILIAAAEEPVDVHIYDERSRSRSTKRLFKQQEICTKSLVDQWSYCDRIACLSRWGRPSGITISMLPETKEHIHRLLVCHLDTSWENSQTSRGCDLTELGVP